MMMKKATNVYRATSLADPVPRQDRRIPQAIIDLVNQYDIRLLASLHVELHKSSTREMAGPCPKCGGTDRFFVGRDFFGCRQCPQPKTYGAINFVMWVDNCSFPAAVVTLAGEPLAPKPERRTALSTKSATGMAWRDPQWQQTVTDLCHRAHQRLLTASEGEPGRAYLLGRGILWDAWRAFQLGYSVMVSVPGTKGQITAPAIVMPWVVRGVVRGIRYRFLAPQQGHKQTAYYGSSFTGILYGGHALAGNIPQRSTLLVVEGELNAVSCWQASRFTHLDVLSFGSESGQLTTAMVTAVKRYRHIIAWLDCAAIVRNKIAQMPGAFGIQSPDDRDANDLLQAGLLAGFLATLRMSVAQTNEEREALLWDLWDAVEVGGVDRGTADVINQLAAQVGG